MIYLFTVDLASALSLYWLVGGLVAYGQQSLVLGRDEDEMETIADKGDKNIIEGEVVESPPKLSPPKKKKTPNNKKRRKK